MNKVVSKINSVLVSFDQFNYSMNTKQFCFDNNLVG